VKLLSFRLALMASALILLACESNVSEEKPGRPIKKIMETIHDAYDNEGTMEFASETSMYSSITRTFFDKQGNVSTIQIFDYKGAPQWRLIYKHDSRGNTIEEHVYQYSEVLLRKHINKFDESDKLIESSVLDGSGNVSNKIVIQPEVDGGQFITTFTTVRGGFVKTMECIINKEGDTLEYVQFNNRSLVRKVSHQYDNTNRVETTEDKPIEKERRITHYKYDDRNNVSEQVELDGSLLILSKETFSYDEKNNLAEIRTYGIMGSLVDLVSYSYEYDKESNWTKRVTYQNKTPVTVTLRQLEYY
jgi:hypothetical protein